MGADIIRDMFYFFLQKWATAVWVELPRQNFDSTNHPKPSKLRCALAERGCRSWCSTIHPSLPDHATTHRLLRSEDTSPYEHVS